MNRVLPAQVAVLALVSGLALAGCRRSAHARFYQLQPPAPRDLPASLDGRQGGVVVAVGPVEIPEYLDRSQIVTRAGESELALGEFDRWVGPLGDDLARFLAEDLATRLPRDRFSIVRWAPLLESQVPVDSSVAVRVERFEGALSGPVVLRAQWGLASRGKGIVFRAEYTTSEPVNAPTYPALVSAMSKAAGRLSEQIASQILLMPNGASPGR